MSLSKKGTFKSITIEDSLSLYGKLNFTRNSNITNNEDNIIFNWTSDGPKSLSINDIYQSLYINSFAYNNNEFQFKKFQNENLGLFQSIKPGREPLHQEMGRARAAVGLVTEPFYFAC